ncbi:uncharacterized protein LOC133187838 [Saccostrea echinata]|uniref:uncharacterized protein LOC133187838 n=1 Tax=Saccostrea echinata TaxID=191078 RepID=UPI002A7F9CAA|nr:uncharacterized protein LOC133187838 [Saccostrea echinata]
MKMDNNTQAWIQEHICHDHTFWLVLTGSGGCGMLIGMLIIGAVCFRYHKGAQKNSTENNSGSFKGTYYFDEGQELSRKPTEFNATSNFYIHDVTDTSSSSHLYENQRHGKVVESKSEESDDDQVDDYIKMTQPKKSVRRTNSKQSNVQHKAGDTAMYVAMQ